MRAFMKRMILLLSVGGSLAFSPLAASAHGGVGFCFWPLWPLSLGVGVGLGCAASTYHSCSSAYSYGPAAYAYTTPPVYAAPPIPAAPVVVETPAPANPAWVPSTPGAGHWVPDPAPYSYSENAAPKPRAAAALSPQSVTVTTSPGNVKVYVVSYPTR